MLLPILKSLVHNIYQNTFKLAHPVIVHFSSNVLSQGTIPVFPIPHFVPNPGLVSMSIPACAPNLEVLAHFPIMPGLAGFGAIYELELAIDVIMKCNHQDMIKIYKPSKLTVYKILLNKLSISSVHEPRLYMLELILIIQSPPALLT